MLKPRVFHVFSMRFERLLTCFEPVPVPNRFEEVPVRAAAPLSPALLGADLGRGS